MTTSRTLLLSTLALALASAVGSPLQAQTAGRRVYCWKDNGRTVCGDALPASRAGAARNEYDPRTGNRTAEVQRAPTAAERSAAEALAQQQALNEQASTRQALADNVLVESYPTEDALRAALAERRAGAEGTVKMAEASVADLRSSLSSLLQQAGDLEIAGKPVGKALQDRIAQQHAQLVNQLQIITRQRQALAGMDVEINNTILRYRAMRQPPAAAPAPAPVIAPLPPADGGAK